MRKITIIYLFSVIVASSYNNASAQDYDVGVFYMPFWHSDDPNPSTNWIEPYWWSSGSSIPSNMKNHHWSIIDEYDRLLVSRYQFNDVFIPSARYYVGSPSDLENHSPANWYNETLPEVTRRQLETMYGIDFVIYDSFFRYCTGCNTDPFYDPAKWQPSWDKSLDNWLSPGFNNVVNGKEIKFAIMWADHFTELVKASNWNQLGSYSRCRKFFDTTNQNSGINRLIDAWKPYVLSPKYKKIDGKPVFYVYYPGTEPVSELMNYNSSIEGFCNYCATDPFFSGTSNVHQRVAKLLDAIEDGIVGLNQEMYFVAVITPTIESQTNNEYWLLTHPQSVGYDALTSYGYKYYDAADRNLSLGFNGFDYSTLQSVYLDYYQYILPRTTLKYQVPVTAGWNRAPLNMRECLLGKHSASECNVWNSRNYKAYGVDNSISTPATFRQSLVNAKNYADVYATKSNRIITICCWNEYAEGTFIEPTAARGTAYVEQVLDVFGSSSSARFSPNGDELATEVSLDQTFANRISAYPNPSSASTTIQFELATAGTVSIKIFNSSGQIVEDLVSDFYQMGPHYVNWDASNKTKGVYFCRMNIGNYDETIKLIVE